jgi:prepilin-type N-terminal cleavage/methylation domain-containing protein
MRRSGFTLAEVLITLAIIGVVAALTIPAVVKNYQETERKTQYKNAENTINVDFKNAQFD